MDGTRSAGGSRAARVKLQKRIYQASSRGDAGRVHGLQRLLVNSRSAKLLAVRRVTQDNRGKKTAGVDGVKSLTPSQRMTISESLMLEAKHNQFAESGFPSLANRTRTEAFRNSCDG